MAKLKGQSFLVRNIFEASALAQEYSVEAFDVLCGIDNNEVGYVMKIFAEEMTIDIIDKNNDAEKIEQYLIGRLAQMLLTGILIGKQLDG